MCLRLLSKLLLQKLPQLLKVFVTMQTQACLMEHKDQKGPKEIKETRDLKALRVNPDRKALPDRMACREKTVQTVLMASLHPSVIMAIGISERLTPENHLAEKRVTPAKKEKRATLEPPDRLAQRAIQVLRVQRAMRSPMLTSPRTSSWHLKGLKVTKVIPGQKATRVLKVQKAKRVLQVNRVREARRANKAFKGL